MNPAVTPVNDYVGFVGGSDLRVECIVYLDRENVGPIPMKKVRDFKLESGEPPDMSARNFAVHPDVGDLKEALDIHGHALAAQFGPKVELATVPTYASKVAGGRKRIIRCGVPGVG
jgi:hypothetical protein